MDAVCTRFSQYKDYIMPACKGVTILTLSSKLLNMANKSQIRFVVYTIIGMNLTSLTLRPYIALNAVKFYSA